MNDTNTTPENESPQQDVWPGKLNKVLIGIGVLAFGFIIADRLVEMFSADDMPDVVEVERVLDEPLVAAGNSLESDTSESVETVVSELPDKSEQVLGIEDAFGSPLVFVSTSEPLYVVTEDDRRFDIGSEIDDETTLAGITNQRVILEKAGNLLVIRLPEPDVQ